MLKNKKIKPKKGPVSKRIEMPKSASVSGNTKTFENPEEMSAFYKAEGKRVKEAIKQFKVNQSEASLGLAKSFYMKLMTQKKNIEAITNDLKSHRKELDQKISELKSMKSKEEIHKSSIEAFVSKMKDLENESKKLLEIREGVVRKEIELVKEMKMMAKEAQRDLDLTDLETANKLAEFESTKEAAIMKARDLLSEEVAFNFADNSILERLDDRAHREISNLNTRLAKLHGVKKETLKKLHLTDITKDEANKKLSEAESKVKNLEEKYQKLLKE